MKIAEKVKKYLDEIEKNDKKGKKINAFLYVNKNAVKEAEELDSKKGKKGRLYGYVIAVKANINVKGMPISCASKVLENYYGTYDANVIEKIKKEDGLIIGICNCDEFASGSSGEHSAFGATRSPKVLERVAGGSSSGSAAAVSAGMCDVALGSDTGGSIRTPASHCGVIGIKPSYGLVSRYGLIDLSMSLDQIGVLGKTIEDVALVLEVIKGKDEKDSATFESDNIKLKKPEKVKIGILNIKGVDKLIQKLFDESVQERIKGDLMWETKEVKLDYIDLAVQTYYPLVYSEFYSTTRRFDGRRYGHKIEEKCGEEVLRRILGGSEIAKAEFRGKYYEKALKIKEIIMKEFQDAFEEFDAIILPTVPAFPWKIGQGKKMKPEEEYAYDALTIPANLAGICAVSIPMGEIEDYESGEMIPVGMQIMCGKGQESKMLSIAKEII